MLSVQGVEHQVGFFTRGLGRRARRNGDTHVVEGRVADAEAVDRVKRARWADCLCLLLTLQES